MRSPSGSQARENGKYERSDRGCSDLHDAGIDLAGAQQPGQIIPSLVSTWSSGNATRASTTSEHPARQAALQHPARHRVAPVEHRPWTMHAPGAPGETPRVEPARRTPMRRCPPCARLQAARRQSGHGRSGSTTRRGCAASSTGGSSCRNAATGGSPPRRTEGRRRVTRAGRAAPRRCAPDAAPRDPRKGLVGPWSHKYPHLGQPGPVIGFLHEVVKWWDRWLKKIDNDVLARGVAQLATTSHETTSESGRHAGGRGHAAPGRCAATPRAMPWQWPTMRILVI